MRKLIEKKLNRFIQLIPTTNHILKMNCEEYLNQKTELQNKILDFIDCETGSDEKFQDLIKLISDSKIQADKNEFTILLNIILSIANNHHRGPNFFDKIEKILDYLKESITKYYSNYLIFDLFKRNKRILLYLFNAKIITMDKSIFKTISSDEKCQKAKYIEYFYPEIEQFDDKILCTVVYDEGIKKEDIQNFMEKRKIGENDQFICELIREDSLDDFIVAFNKNSLSDETRIYPSVYETNLLLQNEICVFLIEYAAFFGSIRIFNFLRNKEKVLDYKLMTYAIHSRNAELVDIIEDFDKHMEYDTIRKFIIESICCHHDEFTNYLETKFWKKSEGKNWHTIVPALKYYNFANMKYENFDSESFAYLCKYDYIKLVSFLINNPEIDVNYIFSKIFKYIL